MREFHRWKTEIKKFPKRINSFGNFGAEDEI